MHKHLRKLDIRFAVRRSDAYQSNIWRAWSWRSDVYVAMRSMAAIKKISFHELGICRDAFTEQHGKPKKLSDREIIRWKRIGTPPRGELRGSCVAKIAFPTDFLSYPREAVSKPINWIDAAPNNGATVVELAFTNELQKDVEAAFRESIGRQLISYSVLPNDERFVIATYHDEWENRDLEIPGEGKVNNVLFSSNDPNDTGRPIRIVLSPQPNDGEVVSPDVV